MSRADSDPNPGPSSNRSTSDGSPVKSARPSAERTQGASAHSTPSDDASSVDPSLLEEVLQNTLSLSSVTPRELSDLIDIGRRYCGEPLMEEPIGVELVEVILRHRLAAMTPEGKRRREMAQQIAESLLEDPHCEPRLRAFWDQLVEAAR